MKAFVAALAAIALLSVAAVVGLELAQNTSGEATAGANVRIN